MMVYRKGKGKGKGKGNLYPGMMSDTRYDRGITLYHFLAETNSE